ncbi:MULTISPECIES: MBL fold metallo-hydrolase [unclassified Paracoccus (in: a-proteobacteria)]|uniref:MBL fold metallo-hydrolase n=1 Tax=unclassified Paracoccus (in: a-proteobacteria) TaxID=2688777 RepID=UPI0021E1372E|nr:MULTISPECIES: MBL fold metallo-hydrolase [unclassified Paracoccus (in: a-proteobacteria)]UXU76330.1 MBL fold metallo-hydrolase [Paracoccus sp. SMMA_5]UXU82332.1 MBL fold metallo-hydrolase [Paracoccus sp. SMMA_5_TC]
MSVLVPAAVLACLSSARAEDAADKYPESVLYSAPIKVADGIYSAIGATQPPTYENAGHNNNLSFIVTSDGVAVVNGGASWKLAQALHDEIRKITEQPVRLVINENGQGHSMLGNSYWAAQGVPILAQQEAAAEFLDSEGPRGLESLRSYARENAEGTSIVAPTRTFVDREEIVMGDTRIEVLHLGPAHSPGDTQVWLPDSKVLIAGDIAFSERMPPIFEGTCTLCWIETFETRLEPLGAEIIVPGHGAPTDLATVRHATVDYLSDLRAKIAEHLENGGDLASAYYVDQSQWQWMDTFEELATKNAGVVFSEMEFE